METEAKQAELLEAFPASTLEQRRIKTKVNFFCHLCKYSYTYPKYISHLIPESEGAHGEDFRPTEDQLEFMDKYLAAELISSQGKPYTRFMENFRYAPDK